MTAIFSAVNAGVVLQVSDRLVSRVELRNGRMTNTMSPQTRPW